MKAAIPARAASSLKNITVAKTEPEPERERLTTIQTSFRCLPKELTNRSFASASSIRQAACLSGLFRRDLWLKCIYIRNEGYSAATLGEYGALDSILLTPHH